MSTRIRSSPIPCQFHSCCHLEFVVISLWLFLERQEFPSLRVDSSAKPRQLSPWSALLDVEANTISHPHSWICFASCCPGWGNQVKFEIRASFELSGLSFLTLNSPRKDLNWLSQWYYLWWNTSHEVACTYCVFNSETSHLGAFIHGIQTRHSWFPTSFQPSFPTQGWHQNTSVGSYLFLIEASFG